MAKVVNMPKMGEAMDKSFLGCMKKATRWKRENRCLNS